MHRQGRILLTANFLQTEEARTLFAVFRTDTSTPQQEGVTEYKGKSPLFDLVVGDQYPLYAVHFDKRGAVSFSKCEE
jgi:hypothetical protein